MSASGSPLHMAIISTADLQQSLSFYRDVIGMEVVSDSNLQGGGFEHHWGLPSGASAHSVLLQASRTDVGQVLLLQFSPASGKSIKEEGVRSHYGLFNLNLYVDDVHRVAADLKSKGFDLWSEPTDADFDNKEGLTVEALFDDPDGVAINLIKLVGGDENSFIGRVRMEVEKTEKTTTGFTPVATSAHIVRDGEAAIAFYRDVLGMSVAMDLEMSSPDSNIMLGRPKDGTTRSAFLEGPHMYGKIVVSHPKNYELPASIPGAIAPNTGYLAQSFIVSDLEAAHAKTLEQGGAMFSSATKLEIPGLGHQQASIIECPSSGALIELISS